MFYLSDSFEGTFPPDRPKEKHLYMKLKEEMSLVEMPCSMTDVWRIINQVLNEGPYQYGGYPSVCVCYCDDNDIPKHGREYWDWLKNTISYNAGEINEAAELEETKSLAKALDVFVFIPYSKSLSYRDNKRLAKALPRFRLQPDEAFSFALHGMKEFGKHYLKAIRIIEDAKKWKGDKGLSILNGKSIKLIELAKKLERIHEIEEFAPYFKQQLLPLPFIVKDKTKYGPFVAFKEDIDSTPFFCTCYKPEIERYISFCQKIDLQTPTDLRSVPLSAKLCHKCNQEIGYIADWSFASLIDQYYLEKYMNLNGIRLQHTEVDYVEEWLPAEIADDVISLKYLGEKRYYPYNKERFRAGEQHQKNIHQYFYSVICSDFGISPHDNRWKNEALLAYLVKKQFPKQVMLRNYRPDWLEGLELDVYLPDMALAFEYQGIQHFVPIEIWGGEEKLRVQQKNDKRKYELCSERGIKLLYATYEDYLSESFLLELLERAGLFSV